MTPSCVYSGLAPITISQPSVLGLSEVSASHVNVVCHGGGTGVIVVSATGGAGTYEYSKDGGLSWQPIGTFSGLTAGSYSIWVRDAATPSCVYSGLAPIAITQPGALSLSEVSTSHVNVVCHGGSTGVIVVSATGGAGTYEYSKDGGLSWQSSGTFSGLTAGSYSIWVRDAAAVSCVYSGLGAIMISEPSLALALVETVASHVNVVCKGGATGVIVVSATGGAGTYEYSKDGGLSWQSSGTFSGLTAGSYSIWVRDAAAVSCVYSGLGAIVISEPSLALALVETVASHVDVSCHGGSTGVIVVSATGGAGTYEYSKDGVMWQSSGTFSGLTAGSYSIQVRDAAAVSCVYSGLAPITITQPASLTLVETVASHVNVVCNGGGTGVIVVSSTGGGGTYEYSKDGGLSWQPIGTFSGLVAGSYSIWVRDKVTPSCVYSGLAPITISQPSVLGLSEVSASHVNVVCNGGGTGVIVVSATGGAGTYEYSKDGGLSWQPIGTFSGLVAGSYSIWVRDKVTPSCVYSGLAPITISQPSVLGLSEVSASHVNVVCHGGGTGVIVVSATGGAGTYEYSKDGSIWQPIGTFSGLVAGSYSIWVRDKVTPSCVYSGLGAIAISEPGALSLSEVSTSHVNVVCHGGGTGVIVVSATGGAGTYEYSKDGGLSWQSSGTFSGLIAGSYSIQVRDKVTPSCVYSGLGAIMISQPGALALVETVASHVNVVCNGGGTGVIVVSSTGGGGTYEYSKDGGLSWQSSGTFSGLVAGSYSIWVRDKVTPSCVYSGLAPITISQPSVLSLSEVSTSHVNVVCNGGSTGVIVVSATGGAGTYEYSKDGGLSWQSSGTFSGLIAGSYSIQVRDKVTPSCVYSGLGAIMISQPGALSLSEVSTSHVNVVCNGGSTGVIVVSATGGAGTYEYSKDGGLSWQSSGTFSGLTAGSYSIRVRDAAAVSCVYSGLGAITISTLNPSPIFAITNSSPIICQGSGSPTNIILNSVAAGMRVTIVGVNATGGVTGASAINTQFNSFPAAISDVLFNPTNVVQSVTYQLQGSIGGICIDPVAYNVVVMVQPVPSASASGITICSGTSVAIPIDPGPQNVSGTTFSWVVIPTSNVSGTSNGNGSTINQVLNLTNYSVGSVIYRITPSANGCAGPTKDVTVTVDPIAIVNAGVDYAVCQPSTILLTGSIGGAATSGTWQIIAGGGSISGSTVSGTTVTATYTVAPGDITNTLSFNLVTNDPDGSALPCNAATGTLHVTVNKIATVTLPADYTVCEPSIISLTGTIGGSATTGLWSVVSGAGVLTATNVSGSTVIANYSVAPSDISDVVVFRLTSNDPDGLGPCVPVFSDIHITINRAARVFAPASLALCMDTPGIALGGSIGGSTSTTVWTGGLGSFSNLNDPNTVYNFKNPNEINTTIVLTITALDPDGGGPCISVSTQTNLKINPLPVVVFSGFPPGIPTQMAENLSPITLTGNQIGGLFTILPVTSNIGSTSPSPVDRVTFDPSAVTLGTNTVTYTYTDGNACTNSNSQSIIINPVTNVDFTIQTGYLNPSFEWEICANQFNSFNVPNPSPSLVKLIGKPFASTGGAPETNFTASVGVNNPANVMSIIHVGSDYYIETNGLPPDTYSVTYTYKNSYDAITSKLYGVIVHAGPVAQIGVANNCISSAIQFNDQSPPTPTDPIVFWKWDFADGSAPVFSQNPSHIYTVPNVYKVIFQVATSFGCSDTTSTKVRVGAVPVVKFTASSICNNDRTRFTDRTTNPNHVSYITKYTWDFGDGTEPLVGDSIWYTNWNKGLVFVDTVNTLVPPLYYKVIPPDSAGSSGTFKVPLHKYAAYGTYHPKLTVNTNDGCVNSYQKSIFILPYSTVKPLPTNAYREDFEATNGGYQVESLKTSMDSSWIWAVPNGNVITGGSKSWWTGLYNGTYDSAESSVVNGPCFNLDSLKRPMISFDYWINTPSSNNDGAVLQYSVNGGSDWINVGVPGSGINWYSSRLIVSNPGIQPVGFGPYGWSGNDQKMWMKASFNLDGIDSTKRKQVRIRFAFAGDSSKNIQGRFNGFAFDNVFVGNKTKNVLIEEFTNTTVLKSLAADDHFKILYSQDSASRKGNTDFNGIQYHVRFPNPDIFSQADTDDPAARALYYGIQQVPYSVMDGLQTDKLPSATFSAGDYNNIDLIEIDRRALRIPPLTILQIDTVNTSPGWKYNNHSITAKVNVRADTAITYPLYAQVALVENPVEFLGVRYQNVVRQLLYAGDGVTKSVVMAQGDTQVFSKGDVEINTKIKDSTKLFLVAFIQNFTTKEILQSAIMPVIKKVGTLITGIEPSIAELEQIQIYPNPASGKFSLSTSSGEYPSNCIWKISDQRGINVLTGNFNDAVNGVKTIDISSLTNGVYFVAIGAPDRNPVYMKLVVMNSN